MLERKIEDMLGSQEVLCTSIDSNVKEAAKKMTESNVGAMLVCDADNVRGLFTERDMLERVVAAGLAAEKTTLGDVMTPDPASASPKDTLYSAMMTMKAQRSRYVLVRDGSKVVGIVSVTDILRSVVEDSAEEEHRFDHLWQGFPI